MIAHVKLTHRQIQDLVFCLSLGLDHEWMYENLPKDQKDVCEKTRLDLQKHLQDSLPKMPEPLKVKEQTTYTTSVSDLEKFIKDATGHEYEIASNEEWGNDTQHLFVITGELQGYQLEQWKQFQFSGVQENYQLRVILEGLCMDDLLEPGSYLINLSW